MVTVHVLCGNCSRPGRPDRATCQFCADDQVEGARKRRRKNKLAVIAHFGGKCSCGEADPRCLTVDHVNNDGHLAKTKGGKRIGTPTFYLQILRRIATGEGTGDLQLLCFNCHAKKDLKPWWHV